MKKHPVLLRGDIMIMMTVLLAALAGLAVLAWQQPRQSYGLSAEIYRHGELLQRISLAEGTQEIRLDNEAGYNVLEVSLRGIRMLEADCVNQDCVRAGLQNRPGSVLVCLPHQVLIRLSGPAEGNYDAVAH